jgi:predicted nucleotidyltransferase
MEAPHSAQRLSDDDRRTITLLLSPILQRSAAQLILFGSRARGDARPASDIDLALRAPEPLPPDLLALARETLEESNLPFRVDLLDYAVVPPEMRQAIDREGMPWRE